MVERREEALGLEFDAFLYRLREGYPGDEAPREGMRRTESNDPNRCGVLAAVIELFAIMGSLASLVLVAMTKSPSSGTGFPIRNFGRGLTDPESSSVSRCSRIFSHIALPCRKQQVVVSAGLRAGAGHVVAAEGLRRRGRR